MSFERKRDQELGIKTVGLREWPKRERRYNRYEATPYRALDRLALEYPLTQNSKVIDFGAGRGRVSIYLHHRFNCDVVGVEVNETTLDEAIWNLEAYQEKHPRRGAGKLRFDYAMAEQYEIENDANCFYFFNPFSLEIYTAVINRIVRSFNDAPRPMDLIVYYPLPEVERFIRQKTPFTLFKKVMAYGAHGEYGQFLIYRAGYSAQQSLDDEDDLDFDLE